ncbi:MAG: orotate phosphoribosyltransferase [Chthoniobacterales bacterium]
MINEDTLTLFEKTGSLLNGHFILRSGLHSRQFFQCALLLQHAEIASEVCRRLAEKLKGYAQGATVISPAVGGIIVGQEIARHLKTDHIFAEKDGEGGLVMRRFEIRKGQKFIVAEDVVTRGGRVQETIDIVHAHGGVVVAAGSIVDRSGGNLPDFGCPFCSLVQMNVETFEADKVPADLAGIPAIKPGSK